ncbi:PucR family transcriptional regulator [Paraburkholderia phytofirmans]|uniref:PucR family transcriptional regulator n=1 Tax=Paraburkholderia phytofirmans TaxID=261302 RepID=UPI001F28E418|nr:helix-turn-helix domain-containing protein [Paraburkholderia phytofirmans]
MTINVPKMTRRLRERTATLAADPSCVIDRTYSVLTDIDGYIALTPAVRRDIVDSITLSAKLWFQSIVNGALPSPEAMEAVDAFGRRRIHQGIPLLSLVRAFRLGSLEVWRCYLELGESDETLRDELLFVVSPYLLGFFDLVAQSITRAYLDEQYQQARWRDTLRYQLCSIVFGSSEDADGFRKAAETLELDPTVPRIALAVDLRLAEIAPSRLEGELDHFALSIARYLQTKPHDLVRVIHRGRVVIWVPCTQGDSVAVSDRLMADRTASLMEALPQIGAVGVGLMNHGAKGWATSVDEAIKALDFGLRANPASRVHMYSDIAIDESVCRSDNVLRYLVSLIEQLSHEPDLLLTLETYFEQLQRRKTTAAVLDIHPNTLNYRLERIEMLARCQARRPRLGSETLRRGETASRKLISRQNASGDSTGPVCIPRQYLFRIPRQELLPTPNWLVIANRPPICSTNYWLIVNPRPAPPSRWCGSPSCSKRMKIIFNWSGEAHLQAYATTVGELDCLDYHLHQRAPAKNYQIR